MGIHLHSRFIKETGVRCDRRALQGWLAAIQENVGPVQAVNASQHADFLRVYSGGSSQSSKFALQGGGGAGQVRPTTFLRAVA